MAFDDWLDDFFASYYRRRPVCATFIGVHERDDELPDFTQSARNEKRKEISTLLDRLDDFPAEDLDEGQRIDKRLAAGALRIQRWENESTHYVGQNPAFYTGKAIFGVIAVLLRDFAPLEDRMPNAVARMEEIPRFLAEAQTNLEATPTGWMQRALDECDAAITLFDEGLNLLEPEGVEPLEYVDAMDMAAGAFREFRGFLESHSTRPDGHGCGSEAFERILSEGHQFEISLTTLAEEAKLELGQQERYLDEHATDFGVESREAALAKLEESHPTVADYYGRYENVWHDCRNRVEATEALTWPEYPVSFVPRPKWVREAATDLYFLYYRAPAAHDNVTPVEYYVEPVEEWMDAGEVERRLRRNNDAQIKLNHVIHHGGMGHHVQNYRAYEQTDSRIGQMAAVDCASRIALYAGGTMAEGWATYATEVMDELDFLTQLESYSLHYSRLRYAARTLVDVKLHAGEMSYEDAVSLYHSRIGMSETAARYEATRNSMFPGMAVLYFRPLNAIHELRAEFEEAHGPNFDLRWFHDEFLSYGSIPVPMIAERLRGRHLE